MKEKKSSTKKTDIWMPIYIGDYLSATSRLTTEQHGAYLLLLMDYWKNGPLPNNDQILAQISRMSVDAWSNAKAVLEGFFEVSDKHWMHSRVEKELLEASHRKQVASNRGKAGAEARWGKDDASSIAQALPEDMLGDGSSPSPSPSPLSSKSKSNNIRRQAALSCPAQVSEQVWSDFLATRKAARAPVTATALKGIEREAQKAGWSLEAALQECTVRGWRGFKADWVAAGKSITINKQEALEARNRAVGDAWLEKMEREENAAIR